VSANNSSSTILPPGSTRRLAIAAASGIIFAVSLGFLGVPYHKAAAIGCIAAAAGLAMK
jgi:hypothetical protein